MNDLTLSMRPIQDFFAKHHPALFICFIALLLAAAIYSLYDVTRKAEASPDSLTSTTITQFNQATVEKIKNLHSSTDTSEPLAFPTSRYNPFVE